MKIKSPNFYRRANYVIAFMLILLALVTPFALFTAVPVNASPAFSAGEPRFITNNFGTDSATELVVQWHNAVSVSSQKIQITLPHDPNFQNPCQTINVTGSPYFGETVTYKLGDWGDFAKRNIFYVNVKNLTPDTTYLYRVGDPVNGWSTTYTHHTSAYTNQDFSFTVTSDPQSGDHACMKSTFNSANDFDPDHRFFLCCGDLVNQIETVPADIADYSQTASLYNTTKIVATTQGNHDTYKYETNNQNSFQYNNARTFNRFVTFPQNGWQNDNPDASQSYYFYYNNVLFIMLNTMIADSYEGHQQQAKWLENVLQTDVDNHRSQYIVVATHIGPFVGAYDYRKPANYVRMVYTPIFSKYKVDVVFSGHDHCYARSSRIYVPTDTNPADLDDDKFMETMNFDDNTNGTVYNIVGATGPEYRAAVYQHQEQWFNQKLTHALHDIQPGNFVNVRVTANKMIITAKITNTAEGEILDTYEIPCKRNDIKFPSALYLHNTATTVNSADITITNTDTSKTIASVEVKSGNRLMNITGSLPTITVTDLRANSTYDFTAYITYTDGTSASPLPIHLETLTFLTKIGNSFIIAGLGEQTPKYNLYRNGELLESANLNDRTVWVTTNNLPTGQYLYRVDLLDLAGAIVATDHTFFKVA